MTAPLKSVSLARASSCPVAQSLSPFIREPKTHIAEYGALVTAMQCANQETISGHENRVAALQAANEVLQQTNRNNPAYSAYVPRPETSTLATFIGDEKNTDKREAAFEIWVVQIRLHLLRHADYYNTPLKQLTMILDHVKGA